ncbi:hypothetical protein C8R46DRAFT_253267 [Mycena filopes]|nr:hypothetical protein C8R46DRAFT_253267 [Mycena filopes]
MFNNGVPLLRELSMSAPLASFIPLPWQQLTKFTGELYNVPECLEALRLMPNLINCAFGADYHEWQIAGTELISHPKIQQFTLFYCMSSFGVEGGSMGVLAYITLPALQTLEIIDVGDFSSEILDSFLRRSAPPLQKLVVRPFPSNNGTELLLSDTAMALGVTEVEISQPSSDFAIVLLRSLAQDVNCWPQLRKLSFHCDATEPGITLPSLLSNAAVPITKRMNLAGPAQLQLFHIVVVPTRPNMLFAEVRLLPFRKLKESGKDVYIGTEEESFI